MKVSVIVPTLNEERWLPGLFEQLKSADGAVETIVADGGSTDKTIEIARARADKVVECRLRGRARQLHEGALVSTGDILLFVHADSRLPPDWRREIVFAWSPATAEVPSAATFRLRFDAPTPFFRFLASAANWRTARTGVPHGDQGIALRRDVYFDVGGFPPVPLMEEYALMERLSERGRLQVLPGAVTTSTRRYARNGPLFNAARNTCLIALYYAGVPPERLARMYR